MTKEKTSKPTEREKLLVLRGESLGIVVQLAARAPNPKWPDILRAADLVFKFMDTGEVPELSREDGPEILMFRPPGAEDHG